MQDVLMWCLTALNSTLEKRAGNSEEMGDYNRMLQDSKGSRHESGSSVPSLVPFVLFCACVEAAGMVQLQLCHHSVSGSHPMVVDEEKERDYSP